MFVPRVWVRYGPIVDKKNHSTVCLKNSVDFLSNAGVIWGGVNCSFNRNSPARQGFFIEAGVDMGCRE